VVPRNQWRLIRDLPLSDRSASASFSEYKVRNAGDETRVVLRSHYAVSHTASLVAGILREGTFVTLEPLTKVAGGLGLVRKLQSPHTSVPSSWSLPGTSVASRVLTISPPTQGWYLPPTTPVKRPATTNGCEAGTRR